MPYFRLEVHWVLLLGEVQEPGAAYAIPITTRSLLGIFLQGADLPATDQCATIPPV